MVSAGNGALSVAVNSFTNKIYVSNFYSPTLRVIDGATNSATILSMGNAYGILGVNPVTNKIYDPLTNSSSAIVVDGTSNQTSTLFMNGNFPRGIDVNPVTNKIYIAIQGEVFVITEQPVQANPLTTSITPLTGNQTGSSTPNFSFNAQSTFSPESYDTRPCLLPGGYLARRVDRSHWKRTVVQHHNSAISARLPHSLCLRHGWPGRQLGTE